MNGCGCAGIVDHVGKTSLIPVAAALPAQARNCFAFYTNHFLGQPQMKIKPMLLASLLSVTGVTAFAQISDVDQVREDNAVIRHNSQEIRTENRAIHRDINKNKCVIAHDQAAIQKDRRDAQQDQRREDAGVARGDLKNAQRLEKARERERAEIPVAQRDIHRDRVDIVHDRKNRNHDAAARTEERAERAA